MSIKQREGQQQNGWPNGWQIRRAVCMHCKSPKHDSQECPTIQLRELQINEEPTKKTRPGNFGGVAYSRKIETAYSDESDDSGGSRTEYGFTATIIKKETSQARMKTPKSQMKINI